jgi:hypothetical protein
MTDEKFGRGAMTRTKNCAKYVAMVVCNAMEDFHC